MKPLYLTLAERDLLLVLCEFALAHERRRAWIGDPGFEAFTRDDWARVHRLASLMAEEEPHEPELGQAFDPPVTYTPPGGRL
jgi:hypothetical protein